LLHVLRRAYQLSGEGGLQDGQAEDCWHRAATICGGQVSAGKSGAKTVHDRTKECGADARPASSVSNIGIKRATAKERARGDGLDPRRRRGSAM
jgi:hypothetical protein